MKRNFTVIDGLAIMFLYLKGTDKMFLHHYVSWWLVAAPYLWQLFWLLIGGKVKGFAFKAYLDIVRKIAVRKAKAEMQKFYQGKK